MKSWSNKHKQTTAATPANQPAEGGTPYLSDNVARNLDNMQSELGGSPDLKVRRIQIGENAGLKRRQFISADWPIRWPLTNL